MEFNYSGLGGEKITAESLMFKDTDLFSVENYEKDVISIVDHTFSAANVDENGPYRIDVTENSKQYIKCKDMRVAMGFKITRSDGTELTFKDEVSFENLPISSIFDSVQVDLYNTQINELAQQEYAYKAYLETLLSFSKETLNSNLECAMFYPEKPGFFDDTTNLWKVHGLSNDGTEVKLPEDHKNFGIWKRCFEARHGEVQLIAPLFVDFFETNKLLPPKTPFSLTFTRKTSNDFFLLTQETRKYKVTLTKLELKVPFVTLSEPLRAHHEKLFQSQEAKYKFQKVAVTRKQIGITGVTDITFDNCVPQALPKQIYFVMVDTSAYTGNVKESPFVFRHNDISRLQLRVEQEMIPIEPLKFDFSSAANNTREAYMHFLRNTGQDHSSSNILIRYSDWIRDKVIFAFDLSPDRCNGFHLHRFKTGRLDILMQLKTALTKPITILVFAVYDNFLTLDNKGHVSITNV